SRSQVMDQAVVDLRELVAEAGPMLRRLFGPRIELTLEGAAAHGHVRADAGQLQQLLMNLCFNARDALRPGGRVWISTHDLVLREGDPLLAPPLNPGKYVVLSVRDDGLGMDELVRQRVFEPFFTTKAPGRGTGLGLSTVYGIVRQSNGHIAVESQPGAGSCFSVYLPAVDGAVTEPRVLSTAPRRDLNGTVLLVDDELAVRELLLKFLESVGYQVVAADSGAAALRLLEGGTRVDIVVSDILMPGMSGTELAQELDQRAPGIPILFMSGYAHDDGARAIASRPNSCFLSKPFGLSDLTGKLRSLLGSGAPARA
ncbi:MAG TPA: response regulator, partial [Polyangiales bacterium]